MGQRVQLFGKSFYVPKGLKAELGAGYLRVVPDPDFVKRRTLDNIRKEENKEKILSIDVINNHWDDFIKSSEKPGFDMKNWLLSKLPPGSCEHGWVSQNLCRAKE